MEQDRRAFLIGVGVTGVVGVAATAVNQAKGGSMMASNVNLEEEVSAAEDLMREHGVLNRILLVYEEGLRRLRAREDVTPDAFLTSARLVRSFVEDYHEKLEEDFLFPAFEKQRLQNDLVTVLRNQHKAGRGLTDVIMREAVGDRFLKDDNRKRLVASVEAFIRMYRPHEAREDTVLFPALPKVFKAKELRDLGEQFEEKEHKLFGDEGFQKTVDQVAAIEKQLGIYELSNFTPKAPS